MNYYPEEYIDLGWGMFKLIFRLISLSVWVLISFTGQPVRKLVCFIYDLILFFNVLAIREFMAILNL